MSGTLAPVIAFNEIPYVWEVPGEYVEVVPNYQNVGALPWPARDLIIAQKLPSGTATAAVAYPVTRPQDATALFGAGSQAEADPTVVTPNRAAASWASRLMVYERNGWVENAQTMARRARFARDPNNRNRLNASQPYQRIGNTKVLAGQLQFQV